MTVAIVIVSLHPLLLPLLVVAGVPVYLSSRRESHREFRFLVKQTPNVRLRQYLTLLLTGRTEAKEVRAFALGTTLRARFDTEYDKYATDLRTHLRRRSLLSVAGNLGSAILLACALLVLVLLIARGEIGLAVAGAAIVAIRSLSQQVTDLLRGAAQIFECGLFLEDLDDFIALRPEAEAAEDGRPAPSRFRRVSVDRVDFAYPEAEGPALRDVSLHIDEGEIVALVGENGSGKTTLAKLLAALYEPTGGSIRWDGTDIREYARRGIRDATSVIFQDFVHYQLSARDNIALGRPEITADDSAVTRAAAEAGAASFLERLPEGYDTVLSRLFAGGRDLSLGQWQRVALARAYFRDAPFVILDEPSAALDPRAEHALFGSIRTHLAGRTVLFISHRFSSVRSADRIYVLHEGAVVEQGTHEDLMAEGGRYAELFTLQAAAYLDAGPVG